MLVHRRVPPQYVAENPFIHLGPVVQKVDNAIHWINDTKTEYTIRWIVTYPVDRVVCFLNNQGLGGEKKCGVKYLV